MRRRLVAITLAAGGVAAGLLAAPAAAEPPTGGPFQHSHHVHTGSGCVDLDSVLFNPEHRGLHQGANASTMARGPWHGTCAGTLYPGGPPLPPFVPHEH